MALRLSGSIAGKKVSKAAWNNILHENSDLKAIQSRESINPFTQNVDQISAPGCLAELQRDGAQVGVFHWYEKSGGLDVFGDDSEVLAKAEAIAAQLKAKFAPQ